jgi:hypothetical protein
MIGEHVIDNRITKLTGKDSLLLVVPTTSKYQSSMELGANVLASSVLSFQTLKKLIEFFLHLCRRWRCIGQMLTPIGSFHHGLQQNGRIFFFIIMRLLMWLIRLFLLMVVNVVTLVSE